MYHWLLTFEFYSLIGHRMGKYIRSSHDQMEWDIEALSKKNPLFMPSYNYLLYKYNKYELTVAETLKEIQM